MALLLEGVIDAVGRTLDVGKHDVDPVRALGFGGGATTFGFQHGARMTSIDKMAERAQPVAECLGLRRQPPLQLNEPGSFLHRLHKTSMPKAIEWGYIDEIAWRFMVENGKYVDERQVSMFYEFSIIATWIACMICH